MNFPPAYTGLSVLKKRPLFFGESAQKSPSENRDSGFRTGLRFAL